MPCILNIETSTHVCSVAVTYDGSVAFHLENYEGPSHATLLGKYVSEALAFIRSNEMKLDAVAVSCGPGSYTGLRIGVSEAKGLCFGADLPLIAIPTLEIMACKLLFSETIPENALFCPMIDARRMEVYAAIYDRALKPLKPVTADIIDKTSYLPWLEKQPVIFFGNGSGKCKTVLSHPNARFIDWVDPLARDMLALSERAFRQKEFQDTAYFEPFYLKEFVATVPKNKIF